MTTFVQELFDPVSRAARRLSEISRTVINAGRSRRINVATPDESETDDNFSAALSSGSGSSRPPSSPATADTRAGLPAAEQSQDDDGPAWTRYTQAVVNAHRRRLVGPIPEDDGMGALRKRLQLIQRMDVSAEDKARLMHKVMMAPWISIVRPPAPNNASASRSSSSRPEEAWEEALGLGALDSLMLWPSNTELEKFTLTADDVRPTYSTIDPYPARDTHDARAGRRSRTASENASKRLGCAHYLRNVKLQCSTCAKWYTCRFCHDAAEDHTLIRKDTKNMLCMLCGCPQRAGEACVRCKATAAQYYCNVCKLWDDHPNKPIYHCDDCGICRRGAGLGKDFFHCKKCCACITVSIEGSHRCIERSTDCDCPICGDYLFTSPRPVVFMNCGHSIHDSCYMDHMRISYKCPICNKSLVNMDAQFRNLDAAIEQQPMPPDWRNARSVILCNDCSARSTVPYHFLGLKCAVCMSYNTVELQLLGPARESGPNVVAQHFIAQAEAALARLEAAADDEARVRDADPEGERQEEQHAATGRIEDHSHDARTPSGEQRVEHVGDDGAREWLRDHALYVRGLEATLRRDGPHAQPDGDIDEDDDYDDEDDDILHLWRSNGSDGTDDDDDEETDVEAEAGDENNVEEEEEEDDDDDYMVLIGHR